MKTEKSQDKHILNFDRKRSTDLLYENIYQAEKKEREKNA